jgi:hypothetical protein
LSRTKKPYGPDASTPASSCAKRAFVQRRWQESPITGESAEEAVKTTAQERRVVFGRTCGDFARVLNSFRTRGYGRGWRPAFPAPSIVEGPAAKLGRGSVARTQLHIETSLPTKGHPLQMHAKLRSEGLLNRLACIGHRGGEATIDRKCLAVDVRGLVAEQEQAHGSELVWLTGAL